MVCVVRKRTRAAVIRSQQVTGPSSEVIAELIAETGPLWHERHQSALASHPRRRALRTGTKHKLVFIDRLLATLAHLRHDDTHARRLAAVTLPNEESDAPARLLASRQPGRRCFRLSLLRRARRR